MRWPLSRRNAAVVATGVSVLVVIAIGAAALRFHTTAAGPARPGCGTLSGCVAQAWRARTSAPAVAAQCDRYTKPDLSIAHSCLVGISDGASTVCIREPASLTGAQQLWEGKATITTSSDCAGL